MPADMRKFWEISGFLLVGFVYAVFVVVLGKAMGWLLAFIAAAAGILIFLWLVKSYSKSYLLLTILVEPRLYWRGGNIPLTVCLQPARPVTLNSLEVVLKCVRVSNESSYEDSDFVELARTLFFRRFRSYNPVSVDILCEARAEIANNVKLTLGKEIKYEVKLPVSRDGLPTDKIGALQVYWTLEANAFAAGLLAINEKINIEVGSGYTYEALDPTLAVEEKQDPAAILPRQVPEQPELPAKKRFDSLELDK